MKRRRVLAAGAVVAAGLSGCLALPGGAPSPESKGPTRGEADANLSAPLREPSVDVEYLPEQDAVRFQVTSGGDYETAPWKRCAKQQCASAARDVTIDYTANRLDADIGGGENNTRVFTRIATGINDG